MMNDLISRQAAIDALNEVVKDHLITDFDAIASILDLPPAQPEKPTEERTETQACDSISRQEAMECVTHGAYPWTIRKRLKELPPAQPEPCEDAVSRSWLLAEYDRQHQGPPGGARKIIETAPPVTPKQPEYHEIGYRECAVAVLKMWMDNVLTDGEHNRIIDKLNAKWAIAEGDAE